jgi:hypothetical protein
MKKLLALVLCVMMFVSVLSTNAFADKALWPAHQDADTGSLVDTPRAAANNDAVKKAKENIDYMYGALAANNAVFGTIQSMDSVISNLAKEMFKDVDSFTTAAGLVLPGSKLESNTKTVLRDYIGSAIIDYLDDHRGTYETRSVSFRVTLNDGSNGSLTYTGKSTAVNDCPIYVDKDGKIYALDTVTGTWWTPNVVANVSQAERDDISGIVWLAEPGVTVRNEFKYDPIKYANTFAAAVNDAFNSKDGASLIEAMAYQLYSAKVLDKVNDEFDDLEDRIADWEDGTAILSQYHFHDVEQNGWFDTGDVFSPFAMMDLYNYPNSLALPAAILVP